MTLHDFITLMILLIGTLSYNEIQYIICTSEYILKLQIHQQSWHRKTVGPKQTYIGHPKIFFNETKGVVH